MITFLLDYVEDGIVMYSYMPEGNESCVGHIGVDLQGGKRIFSQLAPGDDLKTYAFHMLRRIDEFRKLGRFDSDGIVAWC